MRFQVGENPPVEVAQLLQDAGHDAATVLDQRLGGRDDRALAAVCRQEARALVTLDLDFADIRTDPPAHCAGVVVLRLQRHDKPHVLEVFARVTPLLSQEPLAQRLWIVEENRIRIRE
jgi:predicted nuclease of predicted toxin-antitoxin system